MTSDIINMIMPIFNPLDTFFWCSPSFLLSLIVSFHHIADNIPINMVHIMSSFLPFLVTMVVVDVDTMFQIISDEITGHGLIVTMWYG